jgi:hypothetical protein
MTVILQKKSLVGQTLAVSLDEVFLMIGYEPIRPTGPVHQWLVQDDLH